MNFYLKKLKIKNFKNIAEQEIDFDKKTEILGPNRTGKTAVLEALKFNIIGGKVFEDMVNKDAAEAETESLFESGGGQPLQIWRSITKSGSVKTKVLFQGMHPPKPAKFISGLVSAGSFNPKEILERSGRDERLMRLIPIKCKESDLDGVPLEGAEKDINFEAHAFHVLSSAEASLRGKRLMLYQKKDLLSKAFYKKKENCSLRRTQLFKEAGLIFSETKTYEEIFKQSVIDAENEKRAREEEKGLSAEIGNLIKEREDEEKYKTDILRKTDKLNINIIEAKKEMQNAQERIDLFKASIESEKTRLNASQENIDKLLQKTKEIEVRRESLNSKADNLRIQKDRTERRVSFVKRRDEILKEEGELKLDAAEMKAAKERWSSMDDYIKKEWPKKKREIIKPMTDKIPGLNFNESGELELNGVSVSALSESETIELAVNLLNLDKKTSVIAIDGAEALDNKTAGNIDWGEKSVLLIRVGERGSEGFKQIVQRA